MMAMTTKSSISVNARTTVAAGENGVGERIVFRWFGVEGNQHDRPLLEITMDEWQTGQLFFKIPKF